MRLTTLSLAIAFVALPCTAIAQRLAELPQGVSGNGSGPRVLTRDSAPLLAPAADRSTHIRRGALWGAVTYAVLAAGYVVHESATCDGPDCFGEGYAWIGLAAGIPIAIALGAAIGALWPVGSPQP